MSFGSPKAQAAPAQPVQVDWSKVSQAYSGQMMQSSALAAYGGTNKTGGQGVTQQSPIAVKNILGT